MPTLLHGPGCNLGAWYRLPPSCALLGGFAIGARVALLWQHNANPSYKLASISRYDDIVRTAGWAGSARRRSAPPVGDRRATGGAPKTARRIRQTGAAGPPATGRRRGMFSTLLRQSGMRAFPGGVLATKSERKMLASTCLYSLYAWFRVWNWTTCASVSGRPGIYGTTATLLHPFNGLFSGQPG